MGRATQHHTYNRVALPKVWKVSFTNPYSKSKRTFHTEADTATQAIDRVKRDYNLSDVWILCEALRVERKRQNAKVV